MNARLLDEALELSSAERLELLEKLWDSLAEGDVPITDEERKLLDQRIADRDRAPQALNSWDEIKARLAKRHP